MRLADPGGITGVRRVALAGVLAGTLAVALAACAGLSEPAPTPGPASFPEITGQLGRLGVNVLTWASGDAGCNDATLKATAIRFTAQGLDQATPVELRIYIFRDRAAWERRRAHVDACAAAWATDPATFEMIDPSPYVLAGQGPWGNDFRAALRRGLQEASGNGG